MVIDPSSHAFAGSGVEAADGAAGSGREDLLERLAGLEAQIGDMQAQAAEHASHLTALTRDVIGEIDALRTRAVESEVHLTARPYVSDPSAIEVVTGSGATALGYVSTSAGPGDQARSYADFEALFRGTRQEIQARQSLYVDLAKDHHPVLDLGCGRGEFLELLARESVQAHGVDLDPGMVEEALGAGVDARVGDIFEELSRTADASLGMVFCAQVIEHLQPSDMWRLFAEAHRVLRPDGLAVVETVNVHSVRAFRCFWLDTTHTIPVFAETMLMMARSAGFPAAVIVFPGSEGALSHQLRHAGDCAVIAARDPEALRTAGLLGD